MNCMEEYFLKEHRDLIEFKNRTLDTPIHDGYVRTRLIELFKTALLYYKDKDEQIIIG